MKKEIEQARNVILSYIEPSKEPIEELEMANLKVINYIEELEEYKTTCFNSRQKWIKKSAKLDNKLKRIEKELYSSKPMTNRLANCKSILEEGVDQDENN